MADEEEGLAAFVFDYGVRNIEDCTREELVYIINYQARQIHRAHVEDLAKWRK